MKLFKNFIIIFILLLTVLLSGFFYFRHKVYNSHGVSEKNAIFRIEKGQGNGQISSNLEKERFISGKIYFWLYLKTHGLLDKIYPGEYLLSGKMTIPEISFIITNPEKVYKKVLFPEGLTAKKMSEKLKEEGFDGENFLNLVKNSPQSIISDYSILSEKPSQSTLEGYLFPDTYYFSKDATPEGILRKILSNTDAKISEEIKNKAKSQDKSLFQILTMASIIEKEVASDTDREIVSGIFWNRIGTGQPLQSCATLSFILGENKKQYSLEDTEIDSPYNTYQNRDLPPGPISNPGISAILAALNPKETNFNYFLSDPSTGKIIFSATLEEHNANKAEYGL